MTFGLALLPNFALWLRRLLLIGSLMTSYPVVPCETRSVFAWWRAALRFSRPSSGRSLIQSAVSCGTSDQVFAVVSVVTVVAIEYLAQHHAERGDPFYRDDLGRNPRAEDPG